jgi:hypothetical protein
MLLICVLLLLLIIISSTKGNSTHWHSVTGANSVLLTSVYICGPDHYMSSCSASFGDNSIIIADNTCIKFVVEPRC